MTRGPRTPPATCTSFVFSRLPLQRDQAARRVHIHSVLQLFHYVKLFALFSAQSVRGWRRRCGTRGPRTTCCPRSWPQARRFVTLIYPSVCLSTYVCVSAFRCLSFVYVCVHGAKGNMLPKVMATGPRVGWQTLSHTHTHTLTHCSLSLPRPEWAHAVCSWCADNFWQVQDGARTHTHTATLVLRLGTEARARAHTHTHYPGSPQAHDALFAAELRKYDGLVSDVARNVAAQAELLAGVERDNRVSGRAGRGMTPRLPI